MTEETKKVAVPMRAIPPLSQQECVALSQLLQRVNITGQEAETVVHLKQRLAALIQSNGKKQPEE